MQGPAPPAGGRASDPVNIRQLKQFVCVARHRSMTKAAAELFMTQQSLSKAIGLLEEEVETDLFVQPSSGLELTSFGSKLLSISALADPVL